MSGPQAARVKAIATAQSVYGELLAEADRDGLELSQPWAKIREKMSADPKMAKQVGHLPKRLDKALKRNRLDRKVVGRPSKVSGKA